MQGSSARLAGTNDPTDRVAASRHPGGRPGMDEGRIEPGPRPLPRLTSQRHGDGGGVLREERCARLI